MPLSNTPSHNPLKQQAGERGIAVGSSLTRLRAYASGYQTAAKKWSIQKFTAYPRSAARLRLPC